MLVLQPVHTFGLMVAWADIFLLQVWSSVSQSGSCVIAFGWSGSPMQAWYSERGLKAWA